MKKMTCRELGGPCDMELHGETPDEIMHKAGEHIMQANDEEHAKVGKKMEEMKGTEEGNKWKEDFKKKFEKAPEA